MPRDDATTRSTGVDDSPSTSNLPPRKALSPFDREDSDLIIRTSDNVDFYVYRLILSMASPVFESMLSLPQPAGTDLARPHVDLSEDSKTMDVFFRVLYPIPDPKVESLPHLRQVLTAGTKYDASAVVAAMQQQLIGETFIKDNSLLVFAIACLFRMEAEARVAAQAAIANNLVAGRYCPELDEISAGTYYRLLQANRNTRSLPNRRRTTADLSKIEPFCDVIVRPSPSLHSGTWCNLLPTVHKDIFADSPPFTSPDAIIRSSDNHDFRVHRIILNLASPTIISFLEGGTEGERLQVAADTSLLPVYRMKENVLVVEDLLRLCYPIEHRRFGHSDDSRRHYLSVLFAARKYRLHRVEEIMRDQWLANATKDPLRFYFAAAELGWTDEALTCARELIRRADNASLIQTQYCPEMETTLNVHYHRLLFYVDKCCPTASAGFALRPLQVHTCDRGKCTERLPSQVDSTTSISNAALQSAFSSLTNALRKKPCGATITGESAAAKAFIAAVVSALNTGSCANDSIAVAVSSLSASKVDPKSCISVATRTSWAIELLHHYAEAVDESLSKLPL